MPPGAPMLMVVGQNPSEEVSAHRLQNQFCPTNTTILYAGSVTHPMWCEKHNLGRSEDTRPNEKPYAERTGRDPRVVHPRGGR